MDVDIVFAGGEPWQYLSLLRRVRDERLALGDSANLLL
jgi:hypothetical protein